MWSNGRIAGSEPVRFWFESRRGSFAVQWMVAPVGGQQVLKTWLGIAPKGSTPLLSANEVRMGRNTTTCRLPRFVLGIMAER